MTGGGVSRDFKPPESRAAALDAVRRRRPAIKGEYVLFTNQAFRYGDRVYGLLFHLELTPAVIHSWIAAFHDELVSVQGTIDPARIVAEMPHRYVEYQQVGSRVFANLVEHVWEPLATRRHDAV